MTPLQRIREDPEKVRDMLVARGFDAPLDQIMELDRKARDLRAHVESLNAERDALIEKITRGQEFEASVKRFAALVKQRDGYALEQAKKAPAPAANSFDRAVADALSVQIKR